VADETLKPVYLITGGDRPKIQRAIERLRARFDAEGTEHFSAEEASGDEVVASCNALGLFASAGRLVLVTEVDGHRNRDDRMVGGWKAADIKAVTDYLKAPAPDTVLALVGEEIKKDSPLGKACAKTGEVLVYEAERRKLTAWLTQQFKDLGVKAHPDASRLLLDLVGENTDELRLEVEKLALWARGDEAEGGEITADEVEELVAPRGPAKPWTLTDAWAAHDVAGVLDASARLLRRGGTPSGLAWALADHVALVTACSAFAAEGIRPDDAAKRLKRRSVFPVRKAYAHAEQWDLDQLREVTTRLADLDVAIKGGSRLPDELELTRALVDVTKS
jgi:DNA polymerase III delta subunit